MEGGREPRLQVLIGVIGRRDRLALDEAILAQGAYIHNASKTASSNTLHNQFQYILVPICRSPSVAL